MSHSLGMAFFIYDFYKLDGIRLKDPKNLEI